MQLLDRARVQSLVAVVEVGRIVKIDDAVEEMVEIQAAVLPRPTAHEAVVDDPDAFVREAAAAGLGETWSEAAVEPLARALATDPRAAVREAAAVGLGRTWSEAAIAPLTRAAATDPSARVRESAAKALHGIHAEHP